MPQALPALGEEVPQTALPPIGGEVPDHLTPTFRVSNTKDAQGNAVVDPNTFGTFVTHLWSGINPVQLGQLLPFPKALGGSGLDNPLNPSKIVNDLAAVKKDADARLAKKDYVGALFKYVESVVPILGPMLSHQGDEWQSGQYAAAAGDTAALAANVAGGKGMDAALKARYPLASHPAASAPAVAPAVVDFAQQRGIPLDAATVSDNLAVKGTQAIADRSLGGSFVATPANDARAAAMARVGGELADDANAKALTPEQAGTGLRQALAKRVGELNQRANVAYDRLRTLEQTGTAESVGPTRSETTVDLRTAKATLRPIFEQLTRQYPLTQQQSSFGYKALSNILQGPDFAPLSQVDQDLSAIKAVAREQGGQSKLGVSVLEAAVQKAAKAGGPEVVKALQEGRQATIAKVAAADVLDALHEEPVRTVKALTAPKDAAIQSLRAVVKEVPDQTPELARAYLEDLLTKPQAVAEWRKLGTETKAILFPKAGQAQALDHFFALTDRISKTNVNPSGSGYVASLTGQGVLMVTNPATGIPIQIGGAALAKLLRSQVAVNALTRGLSLPNTAPAAVRAATVANLVKAASQSGVVLAFPKAADQGQSR